MVHRITKKKIALTIAILACIGITSCSHYNELLKNPVMSRHGDDESHNQGQNCMQCHRSGGQAVNAIETEKMWNIGGTVFSSDGVSPNPNGYVYLFTKANGQGELKYTLEVDALGNFYTNQIIDFRPGLFPYVTGGFGGSAHMSTALTTGACNSCHGVSTPRITIN